jgi:hypothetical protein
MTDMICRKSMQRCQTPGMCAPHGGCADPSTARGVAAIEAAIATLTAMGYTYNGGQAWKPPIGKKPDFGLIDRLRCQLEVSEDTRQVLRSCLAQAESELETLAVENRSMVKLPDFLLLSDEMRAAGDKAVDRAREDGCASVPVLYGVFFEAAIQRWLNDQEEIIDAAVTAAAPPALPAQTERPAGCCCPPPGHTGIWAGAMCPVHHGLRRKVL